MSFHFNALTDDELAGISRERLIDHYKDFRDYHIGQMGVMTKKDRSAILRMAGNIIGGMLANPAFDGEQTPDKVVAEAVKVARLIVAKADSPNE